MQRQIHQTLYLSRLNKMPLSAPIQSGGTFTPTLTFGGAAVGLVTTNNTGTFTRVGDRIFYSVFIALSAKGSSVGAAVIGGLPVPAASAPTMFYPALALTANMAAGITAFPAVTVQSGTSNLQMYKESAGAQVGVFDTDFSATTQIQISGSYAV